MLFWRRPTLKPLNAIVNLTVMGKQKLTSDEGLNAAIKWLHEGAKIPHDFVFRLFEEVKRENCRLLWLSRQEAPNFFIDDFTGFVQEGSDVERKALEANYAVSVQYEGQAWENQTHLTILYHLAFGLSLAMDEPVILDAATFRFWDADEWQKQVLPDKEFLPENHIVVHEITDEPESVWIHTHGLCKFAKPELELINVPQFLSGYAAGLLKEVASWLIKGGAVADGQVCSFGGVGWMFKAIETGEHYWGAAFRIVPSGDNWKRPRRMKDALMMYGQVEEVTITVGKSDPEMENAYRQARETFPQFKARFLQSLQTPTRSNFGVKVGFTTLRGDKEFVWLMVKNWQGDKVVGIVVNQPKDVPNLKLGQQVTIPESEVCDWIIAHPDGKIEGGFTDAVLRKRMKH